jgi:c-di-GMP-related signal transduction protein
MELNIARQPVFDKNRSIYGYELLYRESEKQNKFSETDGEYASSRVITGAFLSLGLNSLTSGKHAFINFTADLLTSGIASLLPKEQLVVEILEDVPPTRQIIRACEQLKAQGYSLVLDDYVMDPVFEPLAMLADIIKVDFRQVSKADQYSTLSLHKGHNIQFLAEKVETEEEFQRAVDLGYSLFQGYFFARPVILSTSTIPAGRLGYIQLMQAVNSPKQDLKMIISAIESDVKLSLETIKLINSAFYSRRMKISSIQQAVVALGLEGIRKWIYLSAMRRLGIGKPDILVSTSIIRAKFMELLSQAIGQSGKSPVYSMLGLFSLLDVLTNCTFNTLLSTLNITDEIKQILLYHNCDSKLGVTYCTMLAYERGEWESTSESARILGLSLATLARAYILSLKWYYGLTNTEPRGVTKVGPISGEAWGQHYHTPRSCR